MEALVPAFTTGIFERVKSIVLVAVPAQGGLLFAVRVRCTEPAAISADPGVYTGLIMLTLEKEPFPDVVHVMEE